MIKETQTKSKRPAGRPSRMFWHFSHLVDSMAENSIEVYEQELCSSEHVDYPGADRAEWHVRRHELC